MELDAHQQDVRKWFHATDPSPKYIRALGDRQPGTGTWFTNNKLFSNWIQDPNSRLWLHGIPGCGKTVLCSTVIERVLELRKTRVEESMAIGYFYFEFNDLAKQRCDTMLRSLIAQLSLQGPEAHKPLDTLHLVCGSGASQPSLPMLLDTLRGVSQTFTHLFIIVDALDECKERDELATVIKGMTGWEIDSLHMLVTSRLEKDIEDSLSAILDEKHMVCIQSSLVEDDIRAYVQSRVRTFRKLKEWQQPEIQAEIVEVLVEKAGGMFQWVKCQLDALGRCLCLSDFRETLRSLPRDLDNTYARILQDIEDSGHGERAAKIIQWLAVSTRPMSLTEFAEVITVDVDGDPRVDAERRLREPQDIIAICSSLVSTMHRPGRWGQHSDSAEEKWEDTLQFAHFSIREYLGLPELSAGPLKKYAINEIHANTFVAETCIVYLLQFDKLHISYRNPVTAQLRQRYPLAGYAASKWPQHAQEAGESGKIISLFQELLLSEGISLPIWLKLCRRGLGGVVNAQGKRLPLFCALSLDLLKSTKTLILKGADVNSRMQEGGWTPLMQVAWDGVREHIGVVQLLLNHGAEVNAQDRWGNTALTIASRNGHVETVRTLLDNGADIDAHDQRGSTALIVALLRGHAKVVQRLLDRDVSINSPHGLKALGYAAFVGSYETVQTLLDRKIDVNAEFDPGFAKLRWRIPFCTALLQALDARHNDIAESLLEYGADVNARSTVLGTYGVALEHAMNYGNDNMVEFLLKHGADPTLVDVEHLDSEARTQYEALFPS